MHIPKIITCILSQNETKLEAMAAQLYLRHSGLKELLVYRFDSRSGRIKHYRTCIHSFPA